MSSSYEGKQAVDNFLEHHGILGMKWGVRRSKGQLGNTPKIKKTPKVGRVAGAINRLAEKNNPTKSQAAAGLKDAQKAYDSLAKNGINEPWFKKAYPSEKQAKAETGMSRKQLLSEELRYSKEAVKSAGRSLKGAKPDNAPEPLSRKELKKQLKSKEKEWDANMDKIVDSAYQKTKKAVDIESQKAIDSLNIPEGQAPTKRQIEFVTYETGKAQARLMTEEMHRSGGGVSPGQKKMMNFGVTPNGEIFLVKEKVRKRDFAHDAFDEPFETELWHYGILGMKWGVRRDRKGGGVFPNSPRGKRRIANPGKDVLTKVKNKPKIPKAKTMSDKELRERLNRLNMEKQYSDLTSPAKQVGKSFVGKVVKGGATTVATAYVVKYITKGGEKVIEKIAK